MSGRKAEAVSAALVAAGLGAGVGGLPAEVAAGPLRREFDGREDDLLTAGLGLEGLRGEPPSFADPLAPSAAELRRRAVYTAYRGLVDVTDAGGFGRLFGPRAEHQRIAGVEYLVAVRTPDGSGTTTVMLQVPAHFDAGNPCLVVAASSGSRGIYGALPTAGEWGLEHGCAVVHTDKGTGVGFFDLDSGTGYRIDLLPSRDRDDPLLTFRPAAGEALEAWRRQHPHSVAVKHAHSRDNPEKDWGLYVLQAAKVGLALLNVEFPGTDGAARFTRANTRVIAVGVSNGGGAVLRAVEQDEEGLIDGAVVSEPNAQPLPDARLAIRQGTSAVQTDVGRPIFDYATLHCLVHAAAVLAAADSGSPLAAMTPVQRRACEQWAAGLARLGIVRGDSPAQQARDARALLEQAGMLPEALEFGPLNVQLGLWLAVAAAYASAYGRLPVEAPPFGLSFAATNEDSSVRPLTAAELARLAADGSGVPPTGGVQLVRDTGSGAAALAPAGSLEAARQLRALMLGEWPEGEPLPPEIAELSRRVRHGVREVQMSAALRGRPVVILHGRLDALVPVNHSSRAYYCRHRLQGESSVHYYEVEHGQHFDAFIPLLPGWSTRLVPLQPLLLDAVQRMHDHLFGGRPLPPSQVLRTTPRRGDDQDLEPLARRHLGSLPDQPGADAITFDGGILMVPQ